MNAAPWVVDLPSVASSSTTFHLLHSPFSSTPLYAFLSSPLLPASSPRVSSTLLGSFLIFHAFPSFLFCRAVLAGLVLCRLFSASARSTASPSCYIVLRFLPFLSDLRDSSSFRRSIRSVVRVAETPKRNERRFQDRGESRNVFLPDRTGKRVFILSGVCPTWSMRPSP